MSFVFERGWQSRTASSKLCGAQVLPRLNRAAIVGETQGRGLVLPNNATSSFMDSPLRLILPSLISRSLFAVVLVWYSALTSDSHPNITLSRRISLVCSIPDYFLLFFVSAILRLQFRVILITISFSIAWYPGTYSLVSQHLTHEHPQFALQPD
jgi:hypothetical protein